MPRVLVTSFEPFGGHELNSSSEVGRALAQAPPAGAELAWLALPVVAGACIDRAWERVEAHRPDLVLALGQAGSSPLVRLEDRGVNFDFFHTPDNGQQLRRRSAIVEGGPALLRTTIPLLDVADRLRRSGQPVEVSYSAGGYVCNHYYYQLLHRAASAPELGRGWVPPRPRREGAGGGAPSPWAASPRAHFVHLPLLPEQLKPNVGGFAMELARQVECVRQVLAACLTAPAAA
jgi:pyroglutamyl-peptidase